MQRGDHTSHRAHAEFGEPTKLSGVEAGAQHQVSGFFVRRLKQVPFSSIGSIIARY